MNKRILFLFSCLLMMALQPTVAMAELKVGYFNFRQIIDNVPQTKEAIKKLDSEFEPKKKKISNLDKSFKAKKADLEKNSVVLSEADLLKKQREIRALERELKLMVQEFNDDLSIRRNQEMSGIQKQVYQAALDIAKKENFDLLLHNGVLYASAKTDITAKILKQLSAK